MGIKPVKKTSCILIACGLLFAGCGNGNHTSGSTETKQTIESTAETNSSAAGVGSSVDGETSQPKVVQATPSLKVKGTVQGPDGQLQLVKDGLTIQTKEPTSGAEEVAWRYYKLLGEGKYEVACQLLSPQLYSMYHDEPDQKYLREITESHFVRLADITSVAPRENETLGAYRYKVIYLEMNFKLRGKIAPQDTGLRNGLNHIAVHLIQKTEGSAWQIVLLGGSPPLQK